MNIPNTNNPEYGFFGTLTTAGLNADEYWEIAINQLKQQTGECTQKIAIFLDSRHGRHFADDVFCAQGSPKKRIEQTITRWQNWKLGSLAKGTDLPRTMPYLQGMILLEAA